MSLGIKKRPALWAGALSPVVYKMQREDAPIEGITNNAGFASLYLTGDITAFVHVGDVIYVKTDTLDGLFNVTGVSFGGVTNIVIDEPYPGATETGFFNNHTTWALYQVAVNLYDADTDEALLEAPVIYSPNSKGQITIDVQILKSSLSAEIDAIGSYGQSHQDENKSINFYIGYTEQWVGSSNSETLDDDEPRNCIFGAMQILGKNDYLNRVPEMFLSLVEKLRLFIGKYFDLSYYGLDSHAITIEHYDINDTLTTEDPVDTVSGVGRIAIHPLITDKTIIARIKEAVKILPGTEWTDISPHLSFTKTSNKLSASAGSAGIYGASMPMPGFDINNFFPIDITVTVTGTWTGNVGIEIRGTQASTSTRTQDVNGASITANGVYSATLSTSSPSGSGVADTLAITANIALMSGTVNVEIEFEPGFVIYYGAEVGSQEIEVVEPCKIPVLLGWSNEIGGQDWWAFDWNQEHTYVYADGRKVRRLLLNASDLSLEQWNMVNGLNTIGEVYSRSITELDYNVRGTQKRINSQVYLLLDDYTLMEVIVIPIESTTRSRKIDHAVQIQIELPEGFLGNNFTMTFSNEVKRFIAELVTSSAAPSIPLVEWEVSWFGSTSRSLSSADIETGESDISDEKTYQLPEEPFDLIIRIRKTSNDGIAEAAGQILFSKDGVAIPSMTYTYDDGDDVSDLTFTMTGVDASAAAPNDRVNVSIEEDV